MPTNPALDADIDDHKIAYRCLLMALSAAVVDEDQAEIKAINDQTSALVLDLCAMMRGRNAGGWVIPSRASKEVAT